MNERKEVFMIEIHGINQEAARTLKSGGLQATCQSNEGVACFRRAIGQLQLKWTRP